METIITDKLSIASECLKAGELVAVPTETVYGLAANGIDPIAIRKIFEAKERPLNNPLILHFANEEQILPFILDFPPILKELSKIFWPGPLTLLLPKSARVDYAITGDRSHLAVRIPSHPLLLELLRSLPFPLAAPSANLYGTISPTSAAHVYNQLNGRIPIILDGGPCEKGIESTIIGLENNRVHVYRLGGISMEELSLHLEELPLINNKATDHGITSGMVKHHYAPKTPLFFYKEGQRDLSEQSGYIFYKKNPLSDRFKHVILLSESGDLSEAARKLYSVLHHFDEKGLDKISIERFPNEGLGMTLNDRLNRATAKFTP